MTSLPNSKARRTPAPSRVLLPALLFCLLPLGAALPAGAAAPQNTIVSLQTVHTGRLITYDVTVTSTAEFPMGDAIVTLNVGGTEFSNSRYVPGGTLNTLVFSLTRAQFLSLKNGAPVSVYYGADNAAIPAAQWQFGALDTAMLDRSVTLKAPPSAFAKISPLAGLPAVKGHAGPQKGQK